MEKWIPVIRKGEFGNAKSRIPKWNTVCIQDFINNLNDEIIPKALLIRLKKGYSNKRIMEDFNAMMLKIEIFWEGNKPIFIVPFCRLALNIGISHGLVLREVIYPKEGYFANPENTLDSVYLSYI